ncbi:MAG: nucleotidyl transferase AbiEii/AbiGii toxin family protein [Anaerolineae bacterium]
MISRTEVFRLAQRFGVGERVIEKDYVLSWVLIAIAESDLREHVVFKGGTALKKVYFPEYRFSEDLDFTLVRNLNHDELLGLVQQSLPSLLKRQNLHVEVEKAHLSPHESSRVELAYVGPLQARMGSRQLRMDFTRNELLVNDPTEAELKAPYGDYPQAVRLPAYTISEIFAEKLCALMGRTEPRDLYDVWWLLEMGGVDTAQATQDFLRKAVHKGHDPSRLYDVLEKKESVFGRQWGTRLSQQVRDLPHFEEVMRAVRRHLRQLELG